MIFKICKIMFLLYSNSDPTKNTSLKGLLLYSRTLFDLSTKKDNDMKFVEYNLIEPIVQLTRNSTHIISGVEAKNKYFIEVDPLIYICGIQKNISNNKEISSLLMQKGVLQIYSSVIDIGKVMYNNIIEQNEEEKEEKKEEKKDEEKKEIDYKRRLPQLLVQVYILSFLFFPTFFILLSFFNRYQLQFVI